MNTAPSPRSLNTLNQLQQQQNQIMVPIGPPPPLPLNLPCGQLFEGSREDYIKFGAPLFEASIKGDWKAAKAIFQKNPEMVRFAITKNFDTPLHIAASARGTMAVEEFVENLLYMMEKKDIELQNKSYNTAFILAVTAGNVRTAKMMLRKNRALLEIPGNHGMMPLYVAALFARDYMVRYLHANSNNMSSDFWTNEHRGWVLLKCVEADIYDVAVEILNKCTQFTTDKRILGDVLLLLAQKTDAFIERKPHIISTIIKSIFHGRVGPAQRESESLQLLRTIWNKIAILPNDEIDEILLGPPVEIEEEHHKKITYPSRVPFIAAKMGNIGFLIELLLSYPDLMWMVDDEGLSIFHIAVKYRHEAIYNLLYEIGSMKELITSIEDKNGNNMLHIVAKIAHPKVYQNVPGVALQMQREILWFKTKEVELMIPPAYRAKKNRVGETPYEIFTKNHDKLLAESEKWIKETAPQCLVGATIIATMVFTASFTAPGGYDQNTGIPMLLHKPAFLIFLIADALSLIFSSASILMLLSMFTSRYAERDFLEALPKKLMIGLATLYTSIVTMMIAFSASFFVLYYNKNLKWIPIMVAVFVAELIVLFALIQFTFLKDIFYSTYRSRALFYPKKRMLYQ
ncbi:uncharacterized protein LOC111877964 [Lactuca sativa]|uniref:uncharacterized protein LOC111877964 n=1 Tax=Lactuca sativa TaxID=4236 RepID=UPI001C687BE9|nr:uncharacterized protein LOC111877964 [Lactuca sativa]